MAAARLTRARSAPAVYAAAVGTVVLQLSYTGVSARACACWNVLQRVRAQLCCHDRCAALFKCVQPAWACTKRTRARMHSCARTHTHTHTWSLCMHEDWSVLAKRAGAAAFVRGVCSQCSQFCHARAAPRVPADAECGAKYKSAHTRVRMVGERLGGNSTNKNREFWKGACGVNLRGGMRDRTTYSAITGAHAFATLQRAAAWMRLASHRRLYFACTRWWCAWLA